MREFLSEPWAFFVIFAIVSNVLWGLLWIAMWATGRFKESIGRGVPVLLGVGLFNIPFGFLFTLALFLGTVVVSVFWLYASMTNTFESERKALATFINPKAPKKGGRKNGLDENEETKS